MPVPSPFHERTSKLCTSYLWKEWSGYHAVRSYDTVIDREYFAFRHAAGLIDVTPLFKYDVTGKDAAPFLARVMVRNIVKLRVGRVTYCCWTDDAGKVIDDGTITRWGDEHFRVTSNAPSLRWFETIARGFDVAIRDTTADIAVLALQGPEARTILQKTTEIDLGKLRFFRAATGRLDKFEVGITRTGYTGDLGYEIWTPNENALTLYDAILDAGRQHMIEPCGLDTLDVVRIEAGFMLHGIDYFNAKTCLIEDQKSTPYEIALDWAVQLDREPFIGQSAIRAEKERGVRRTLVGLEISWADLERLFDEEGLPPSVPLHAWRDPRPVFRDGTQVGQATSGVWSPILKKYLAIATVNAPHDREGTALQMELTVEFERKKVKAKVVPTPFFDPERKRA